MYKVITSGISSIFYARESVSCSSMNNVQLEGIRARHNRNSHSFLSSFVHLAICVFTKRREESQQEISLKQEYRRCCSGELMKIYLTVHLEVVFAESMINFCDFLAVGEN